MFDNLKLMSGVFTLGVDCVGDNLVLCVQDYFRDDLSFYVECGNSIAQDRATEIVLRIPCKAGFKRVSIPIGYTVETDAGFYAIPITDSELERLTKCIILKDVEFMPHTLLGGGENIFYQDAMLEGIRKHASKVLYATDASIGLGRQYDVQASFLKVVERLKKVVSLIEPDYKDELWCIQLEEAVAHVAALYLSFSQSEAADLCLRIQRNALDRDILSTEDNRRDDQLFVWDTWEKTLLFYGRLDDGSWAWS